MFFEIQIPVCRITMQARGFAVWTTPTPRGDWNTPCPHTLQEALPVWTTPTPRGDWNPERLARNREFNLVWTTTTPRGDWNPAKLSTISSTWLLSEPPLHREVIETSSCNHRTYDCICLNHPYTVRWLKLTATPPAMKDTTAGLNHPYTARWLKPVQVSLSL